jgi:hypothetical protein
MYFAIVQIGIRLVQIHFDVVKIGFIFFQIHFAIFQIHFTFLKIGFILVQTQLVVGALFFYRKGAKMTQRNSEIMQRVILLSLAWELYCG